MNPVIKFIAVPMLLSSGVGCAASGPAARNAAPHYTERTCTFAGYGSVTVHEQGIGGTYIIVHGRRHPATGGLDFVQSDDDGIAVTFDRQGNPLFRGEIPGRNCHLIRR